MQLMPPGGGRQMLPQTSNVSEWEVAVEIEIELHKNTHTYILLILHQ